MQITKNSTLPTGPTTAKSLAINTTPTMLPNSTKATNESTSGRGTRDAVIIGSIAGSIFVVAMAALVSFLVHRFSKPQPNEVPTPSWELGRIEEDDEGKM